MTSDADKAGANTGWDRVSEIVAAAIDLPAAERAAFVASMTGGEPELEREVQSLLVHSSTADALETGGQLLLTGVATAGQPEALIGERLGAWRLVSVLGQGGMGVVYAAERVDGAYEQRAAIKLLRDGLLDPLAETLLRGERQHLARLQHPNIARLIDGGQTPSGRAYLVMEFVEGKPIDAFCADGALSLADRIRLLLPVFDAVQSAHEKLIIHRDIKPANVLVSPLGEPKLLDFGVAKLLDANAPSSAATQLARLPFTPRYASPEQIDAQAVTVRTDVYGLGVLAYELLAGESPFACFAPVTGGNDDTAGAMTPWQALDALRHAAPRRASVVAAGAAPSHARALRGDLETILAKAIARDPAARYASVAAFADDLRAYLDGRPVQARPVGRIDRAWKFCKRHPYTVSLATTLSVALLAVTGVALWQAARAERAAAEAQARTVALRQIARAMIFDVNDALAGGTTAARGKLLATATQFLDGLNAAQGNDLSLKRDTAEAFERLGDIAGNASQSNLGDAHAAESHYSKALVLREQLLHAVPGSVDEANGMVKIHQRLARMALDRGAPLEAKRLADVQLQWAERVAHRRPDDLSAQLAAGEARLNLAVINYYPGRQSLGKFADALTLVQEAVAQRAALHEKHHNDATVARGYAQALIAQTQLQLVHGLARDALATVQRVEPVLAPAWRDAAQRNRIATIKISELRHHGEALLDIGDAEQGLLWLTRAVALADEMAAADPRNVFLERRAATTRSALAYQQLRAGDIAAALPNSRAYLEAIARQYHAQPESTNLRVLRDDAVTALIEALLVAGKAGEAATLAERQIALERASASRSMASDERARQFSIVQAKHWQGKALLAARPADAQGLALVREAAAGIDATLAGDAADAHMQRSLAEQRLQAAEIVRPMDSALACTWFRKANAAFAALQADGRLSALFAVAADQASRRAAACTGD